MGVHGACLHARSHRRAAKGGDGNALIVPFLCTQEGVRPLPLSQWEVKRADRV
jgi:hypothetical protein